MADGETAREIGRSSPAPLFLLSFNDREALAQTAVRAGWHVVAARRGEGAAHRFAASAATVAVIDARGAPDEGLAAVAGIAPLAEARGAALLALISGSDIDMTGLLHDAGATHFLAEPFTEGELVQTLRFVRRYVERLSGHSTVLGDEPEPLGWRADYGAKVVQLTPALAVRLSVAERVPLRHALRLLGNGRALLFAALRRLRQSGRATAFAHDAEGLGRVVHHLQADGSGAVVHALVEVLGAVPDAVAAISDMFDDTTDADGMRLWLQHRLDLGGSPAVILVSLSRFDLIDNAYGPRVAQSLLQAAVRRVTRAARASLGGAVVVATAGPAQFLIAAPGGERIDAAGAALAEVLLRPFALDNALVSVGARVGIASARAGDTAADLLARASYALSAAQASDSTHVHHAERPVVGEPSSEALAADLGRAIESAEIAIVFQPQVAIGTGVVVGVEALARWAHPVFGEVGANALFAAAERADLGVALSDHIQRRVLAIVAQWRGRLATLRVAINLTAADIARPGFADLFLDRVDKAGFPRGRLTVEITESGLIQDLGAAAALLAMLRGAGCRVAIDDFGTGYSSLAYLKVLPLDYLKIDKQLAQDITGSPRDRVVVRGVIDMARSLGLAVVAEGVETPEQLALLAEEGCNFYQGFLCAEPMSEAALVALLTAS